MKKTLILLLLLLTLISVSYAQQCEVDEECTETYCTIFSHKTYSSGVCDAGSCKGSGTSSCIIGSCDALCDSDDDCNCPQDFCNGPNLIDYPDNGRCGTAGSEGCLCQVSESTGGYCEPVIVENHINCISEFCESSESARDCILDGFANVEYEWNYPECGDSYSVIQDDSSCNCLYTGWEEGECISDGIKQYEREELSGYNYCTDSLLSEEQDDECECESFLVEEQCTSNGYSQSTYDWNYQYCENSYTIENENDFCLCEYSEWEDNNCIEDSIMEQSRYQLTDFNYCIGPYERQNYDSLCTCTAIKTYSECVIDGYEESSYEWNYQYCPDAYTQTEQNQECDCDYTEWLNDDCYAEGVREQTRDESTGFYYCTEELVKDYYDDSCNCLATEQNRECSSNGFSQVDYEWNYNYCGIDFSQEESDSSCLCTYTQWTYIECVSNGFSSQERYETSSFGYCEDTLYREVPNPNTCSCRSSETGRVCVSDGFSDVFLSWNYQYCGQPYIQNRADNSCACIYDNWLDTECISDGYKQQIKNELSDFEYCSDNLFQEIPETECGCFYEEQDRECVDDGYSEVLYNWNFEYCGNSFISLEDDAPCSCIYTEWANQGCSAFNSRRQTRLELSGFSYCEESLFQVVEDFSCDVVGNRSVSFGIVPGNSCPEIIGEINYDIDTSLDGETTLLDLAFQNGFAGRSYAFDGELISFQFEATDYDGIMEDCVQGYITLDNGYDPRVVQCIKQIHENDFSTATFTCEYYVEDALTRNGEYWISVEVADNCGQGCFDASPGIVSLYLNPSVGISLKTQGNNNFGFMYDEAGDAISRIENGQNVAGPKAGDKVYTPYFIIENSADEKTGLYMLMKMYGTDFRATPDTVALCPTSNRLEIANMFYEASHLNAYQPWTMIPDGTNYGALEADYIFKNWAIPGFNAGGNFLGVGDDITLRLRLDIPSPCIGEFTKGGEVVFIGQVV